MNIGQWFLKDNESEISQNKTKALEHNCHTLVLVSIKFEFLFHVIINHDTVLRCITFVLDRIYHIVRFVTSSDLGRSRASKERDTDISILPQKYAHKKASLWTQHPMFCVYQKLIYVTIQYFYSQQTEDNSLFFPMLLLTPKKKTYVNILWDSTHSLVIFNDTKRTFGRCYRLEKLLQYRSC